MKFKTRFILLIISIFIFSPFISISQIYMEWQRCYGGSDYDQASSIVQTTDGGFISIGVTRSTDGDITNPKGNEDVWVIKIDSNANLQWQTSLGGSDIDFGSSVIQVTDGGYLLQSATLSSDSDVTNNHGNWDIWLVKLDSMGNLQWQRCYGSPAGEEPGTTIEVADGYIFVGSVDANGGDVSGFSGGVGRDAWLVKIDYTGNILWQKCIYGLSDERGHTVKQTSDGGFLISGDEGDIVTLCQGQNEARNVKVDSLGNIVAEYCRGGFSDDESFYFNYTSDGGTIMLGTTFGDGGNVNGFHGNSGPGSSDIWILKQDAAGNIEWQRCLGGTGYERAFSSVIENSDGSFILVGTTDSNDGDVTGNNGSGDLWIAKVDGFGNIIYSKCFGGTNIDFGWEIVKTSNGRYVAAGYTGSNDLYARGFHGGGSDFWIIKLYEDFNLIKGNLYADNNANQVNDSTDIIIPNKMVSDQNNGQIAFSNQSGNYNLIELNQGNYTVSPGPINNYHPLPLSQSAVFTAYNQTDSMNDFAFQPDGILNDLCVTITPMNTMRPGFNEIISVNYENAGTAILNGTIWLHNDNRLLYISSTVNPTLISADSISWNIDNIKPFEKGNFLVTFNTDSTVLINDTILTKVRIEPLVNDINPACNYDEWYTVVRGSYDPNEKMVNRSALLYSELNNPPYLDYIINFQNTGNDTAFTINIKDNIPDEEDIYSFEFIASSHPVNINYGAYSRLISFQFNNILLPDSNINEHASHGFVRYRIKPLTTLVPGDTIRNRAHIFFDYNIPVNTNFAKTAIISNTGIQENSNFNMPWFTISPNPSDGNIKINYNLLQGQTGNFLIYDMQGKELFKIKLPSNGSDMQLFLPLIANGIYNAIICSGSYRSVRKMVIITD